MEVAKAPAAKGDGFEIIWASDGQDAIDILTERYDCSIDVWLAKKNNHTTYIEKIEVMRVKD